MQYQNLEDLISHSSSSRRFFLSLPVPVQRKLHERHSGYIHNALELHARVDALNRQQYLETLGGWR